MQGTTKPQGATPLGDPVPLFGVVASRTDRPAQDAAVDFDGDSWLGYTPIQLPDTLAVRDRPPKGAAAVLINRNHNYTDLYLPIETRQARLLATINGERTIEEICRERGDHGLARVFFQQLWRWDQIVLMYRPEARAGASRLAILGFDPLQQIRAASFGPRCGLPAQAGPMVRIEADPIGWTETGVT